MAIGTVEFDLSMVNPDTGLYNTARLYTIDGVNNVDGTPRELSIGQLVMAICLQRASQLENGYDVLFPILEKSTDICTDGKISALYPELKIIAAPREAFLKAYDKQQTMTACMKNGTSGPYEELVFEIGGYTNTFLSVLG